jgi:nitrite reductase (NADH) small subunit
MADNADVLVGRSEEIAEGSVVLVEVDGVEVGVVRAGGVLAAFENRCPHQGGPVCYGEVLGQQEAVIDEQRRIVGERFSDQRFNLICPWHGWSYDVATGENICDRRFRLRRWPVVTEDGAVYLRRPERGMAQ